MIERIVGDLRLKRAAVDTARNVVVVAEVIDKLMIEYPLGVADAVVEDQLSKAFNWITDRDAQIQIYEFVNSVLGARTAIFEPCIIWIS